MRTTRFLLFLTGLLLATTASAKVSIQALAGAGGYIRHGAAIPVLVMLENDEAERNGRVEVRVKALGGTSGEASRSVPLPPLSKKAAFLYVPGGSGYAETLEVRYLSARGQAIATFSEPLQPLPQEVPTVCIVDILPSSLPPTETEDDRPIYQHVYLKPDQVPDRFEGLEMFDAMVISPAPYVPIETNRLRAIHDWVLRGGTLVIDTSKRTEAFRSAALRGLLPFVPQGTDQAVLDVFGKEVTFGTGTVVHGEVLLESNGHPLVVRRSCGLGSVTCFAVSPGDPVLARWEGSRKLWADVLGTIPGLVTGGVPAERVDDEARRGALMGLVQEAQRTGLRLGLVLLLTVLYALAVGPGDYLLIKRLKRPKLTWITFPAIVAVFTITAYIGAKAWVGGEMAAANMRRLLVIPAQQTALRYDIVSLFAPDSRDYRLAMEGDALPVNIRQGFAGDDLLRIEQDEGVLVHRIPIWQRRVYGADQTVAEYPAIDLQVTERDGNRVAVLTNGSDWTLRNCQVVCGEMSWRVAPNVVEKGQEVVIALDDPERVQRGGQGYETLTALARYQDEGVTAWSGGRQFDIRDALRRGAVLFHATVNDPVRCPLTVDGKQRPESGRQVVQVLAYREGEGQ
jgi:hypothetical protein